MLREDLLEQIAQLPIGMPVVVELGETYSAEIDRVARRNDSASIFLESSFTIAPLPPAEASAQRIKDYLQAMHVKTAEGRTIKSTYFSDEAAVLVFIDGTFFIIEGDINDDCESCTLRAEPLRQIDEVFLPYELVRMGLISGAHGQTLTIAKKQQQAAKIKAHVDQLNQQQAALQAELAEVAK
ncbi:hypothetical protein [Deefgea sp. CFH1-16]|uniref:hypothetical protein n=1 Tax=Deefgea sp. CFH1-16 TaxID=2675457 RepID=UPI0015F44B06|nr:hypothetical protein [Deefgea sp. CFH1-16]MBM5575803.1 hypothetical protein [Deefgea sp. CFH1-16]